MRRVVLGDTGIETSALGFGCASLGSRIGPEAGRRALAEAFEAGVTWLDLAPVYGGGEAEAIAAPFLRAHRAELQICSKAGLLLADGAGGGFRRRIAPLARDVLALAGAAAVRLGRAVPKANRKPPLTPALLVASLEASLRRLGTDHVDLFALHAPEPEEVGRDDIRAALERIVAAGKARAVAVAGDAAAAAAALAIGAPYAAVQLAVPRPGGGAAEAGVESGAESGAESVLAAAPAAGFGTILHSVFGRGGVAAASSPGEGRRRLDRAFALNPSGVVLVSMLSPASRAATLAAVAAAEGRPPAAAGRGR